VSNAEDRAAEALRQSFLEDQTQIAMTEGARLVLTGMLRQELPAAIAVGIKTAMTPEAAAAFADALIAAMQARATERMDKAAGGLIRMAFKKLTFFVIAGLIVYGAGGWGALIAVGKWIAPDWMK
jgi:hypothetical protein